MRWMAPIYFNVDSDATQKATNPTVTEVKTYREVALL